MKDFTIADAISYALAIVVVAWLLAIFYFGVMR